MNKKNEVQDLIMNLNKLESKVDEFMLNAIHFVSEFERFGYSQSQQKQLLETYCINRLQNLKIEDGIRNFEPVVIYEEEEAV